MTARDRALAVAMTLIWGTNFVVIDAGMHGIPPLLFAALRFVFVAFPLVLFVPRPAVRWQAVVAIGTFMFAGQYGFLYLAMANGLPAGLASLVLQLQVPLTVVFATVALRERPRLPTILGVGLGALGLAIIAAGRSANVQVDALLLCAGGAISWAVGNVIARATRAPGGFPLTIWAALVPPVPLFALALLVDGPSGVAHGFAHFGLAAVGSTAFTVVLSTIVGFSIYNGLLRRHPASTVVPWVLLVPPFGIAAAALLLGERPSEPELVGGAILILGAWLAQRSPRVVPLVVSE
ncbi:MAG: EamA family transporter [Marmoricola sp.]